jgi:protocatechuate 3,4-dioxygenase beta subunit
MLRSAIPLTLGVALLALAAWLFVEGLGPPRKEMPQPTAAEAPHEAPGSPPEVETAAAPAPAEEEEEEEPEDLRGATPLAGRVLDAEGKPIAGATVRWSRRRGTVRWSRQPWPVRNFIYSPEHTTTTDAAGHYAFAAVVPNDAHIRNHIEVVDVPPGVSEWEADILRRP